MLILARAAADALADLKQLKTQSERCTMFVFGDGPAAQHVADEAALRADGHEFRQVVWVPEPSVMDGVAGYDELTAAHNGGARVAVMTIDFRVSSTFGPNDRIDLFAIENAFIDAELAS